MTNATATPRAGGGARRPRGTGSRRPGTEGSPQGRCRAHGPTGSYRGEGHDASQVLLADEDLGHGGVCGRPPRVLDLPGDGLRPRQAAEAGDFEVHLHDLAEQAAASGEGAKESHFEWTLVRGRALLPLPRHSCT